MRRLFFGAALLRVALATVVAPRDATRADTSALMKLDEAFAAARSQP